MNNGRAKALGGGSYDRRTTLNVPVQALTAGTEVLGRVIDHSDDRANSARALGFAQVNTSGGVTGAKLKLTVKIQDDDAVGMGGASTFVTATQEITVDDNDGDHDFLVEIPQSFEDIDGFYRVTLLLETEGTVTVDSATGGALLDQTGMVRNPREEFDNDGFLADSNINY